VGGERACWSENVVPGRIVLCWVCSGLQKGFYPKKGGVENIIAGCNGGRYMVVPCESIGVGEGVGSARACWSETFSTFSASASAADQAAERLGGPLSDIPICVAPVNVMVS